MGCNAVGTIHRQLQLTTVFKSRREMAGNTLGDSAGMTLQLRSRDVVVCIKVLVQPDAMYSTVTGLAEDILMSFAAP